MSVGRPGPLNRRRASLWLALAALTLGCHRPSAANDRAKSYADWRPDGGVPQGNPAPRMYGVDSLSVAAGMSTVPSPLLPSGGGGVVLSGVH